MLLCMQYSCQTDAIINQSNIATWTKDLPAQNKDLYQIRLAFGKTLATALKEEELRTFIKTKSIIPGEKIYQELVYALIKDEKLPSGKTVKALLQSYEDAEIKELFGSTLQERVAIYDPMLVIKLPDIFHHMDWNTDKIIPFVGIQTPLPLENLQYPFYYHNGYYELLKDANAIFYQNLKYFYLMVKYSSDHILLNVNNLANEKNIALDELLPQITYCKESILDKILTSGYRDFQNPNYIILNKSLCYNIWKEFCAYNSDFAYSNRTCGLPIHCPRNCDSNNPLNKNLVLTGFDVRNELYIVQSGYLFTESVNVSFDFLPSQQPNSIKRFIVPSIRYVDLNKFKVEVNLEVKEILFDGYKFDVPLVSTHYKTINDKSSWVPINALMFDDVIPSDSVFYAFCINLLFYEDVVNSFEISQDLFYCLQPYYTGNKILNPSRKIRVYGSSYDWCTNTDVYNGNFGIGIKY